MLADGLAYYYKFRILVVDLDFQADASRSLIGEDRMNEVHKKKGRCLISSAISQIPQNSLVDIYTKRLAT